MFICVCNAITEHQVQAAVAGGAASMADLQGELGVASCCGCCAETAAEYLPGGRYASEHILRSADEGALVCDAANDSALADGMLAVEARRA
jgi:bacterioferritin-associated ferredoxin